MSNSGAVAHSSAHLFLSLTLVSAARNSVRCVEFAEVAGAFAPYENPANLTPAAPPHGATGAVAAREANSLGEITFKADPFVGEAVTMQGLRSLFSLDPAAAAATAAAEAAKAKAAAKASKTAGEKLAKAAGVAAFDSSPSSASTAASSAINTTLLSFLLKGVLQQRRELGQPSNAVLFACVRGNAASFDDNAAALQLVKALETLHEASEEDALNDDEEAEEGDDRLSKVQQAPSEEGEGR
jgi:hypothetical protein